MSKTSIHHQNFDTTSFEIQRSQVFERSLAQQQFSENYQDFPTDNFSSGEWDGLQGFEPETHQWASADYRRGYHSGIDKRFNKLLDAVAHEENYASSYNGGSPRNGLAPQDRAASLIA